MPNSRNSQDGHSRLGWTDKEGKNVTSASETTTEVYAQYGVKSVTLLTVKKDGQAIGQGGSVALDEVKFGDQSQLELTLTNEGNQDITNISQLVEGSGFQAELREEELKVGRTCTLTITSDTDLPVGSYTRELRLTYSSKTSSRAFLIIYLNLRVTKGLSPVTVTITGAEKVYGQTLSQDILISQGKVTVEPEIPFESLGVSLYSDGFAASASVNTGYEIKATESQNYDVTVKGTVKVIKATPSGAPSATGVKVGQTLADSSLSGTFTNPYTDAAVEGTLEWKDSKETVLNTEGTFQHNWKFTPANAANYEVAQGKTDVVVSEKTATTLTVVDTQLDEFEYDGKEHPMVFKSNRPAGQDGAITVKYAPEGTLESETEKWTDKPPVDAGKYIVHATMEGNSEYAPGNTTKSLTIKPRVIKVSYALYGKTYDGTTDVPADRLNVYISNRALRNEDVSITASGKFDDPNAGSRNVTITVDSTIGGTAAENYQLPANLTYHDTAMISPKTITITPNSIEKAYGGDMALGVEQFNVSGLAKGDGPEKLAVSFSSQGTGSTAEVGKYDVLVSLARGNYTLANNGMHQATSTTLKDAMSVVKAVPQKLSISAGEGKQGGNLGDVSLNGEFVNPYAGWAVEGTFSWVDSGDTVLPNEYKASKQWRFTLSDEAQKHYAFADDATSITGEVEIMLVEKQPIPLSVESASVPYDGKAHGLKATVGLKGVAIDLTYTYTPKNGTALPGEPVNVGAYDVTVKADFADGAASEYTDKYAPNIVTASLTITRATPTTDLVKKELEVPQGTLLSSIGGNMLGLPTGVDGELLNGTYSWTETGSVEQAGTYNWTFTPANENYAAVTGTVTIKLTPDDRTVSAQVFNLPDDQGFVDYAVVDVAA